MLSVHAAKGFTTQARLGFPAGDDWEPALTADRYGHVYVLYKHYDIAGQTSCSSCDLHVLLQVSSDRGQTWSVPRPIDPQVSDYVPGYAYLTPTGFGLPYGDYFQMSVDDRGRTQIAWGEAGSYSGPGNIWTSHG